MNRLNDALQEMKRAKMAMEEAKIELISAVVDIVAEGDGVFARDVAAVAGVPTCEIVGYLQRAENAGVIRSQTRHARFDYARIMPNGTVNLNDVMHKRYKANVYCVVNEE
jgi:GTP-sensing pleiotropic transcriptional regulator CodY